MLPQYYGQFQLILTERNHCSEHPNGKLHCTYTICESVDAANGSNNQRIVLSHVTVNVVGKIVADDDTLGTPSPLASGSGRRQEGKKETIPKRSCVSTNNTNVTPITGALIDVDGNVTIAANTPTGSYTVSVYDL
jgi:hypothetical protein